MLKASAKKQDVKSSEDKANSCSGLSGALLHTRPHPIAGPADEAEASDEALLVNLTLEREGTRPVERLESVALRSLASLDGRREGLPEVDALDGGRSCGKTVSSGARRGAGRNQRRRRCGTRSGGAGEFGKRSGARSGAPLAERGSGQINGEGLRAAAALSMIEVGAAGMLLQRHKNSEGARKAGFARIAGAGQGTAGIGAEQGSTGAVCAPPATEKQGIFPLGRESGGGQPSVVELVDDTEG